MFGTNLTLPTHMLSYNSALAKYNSIKPIRGRQDQNTRPLVQRRNDNLTIRQDPQTSDIVVRLYQTDIIRYTHQPGGDNDLSPIILDPYASSLTNRVMWSILGPHVNTHWSDAGLTTEVGGRYYNTPSYAVIQPKQSGWELVEGSKPIEVPYLNRKEARQALLDANYYTFKLWLETRIRLGLAGFADRWTRSPYDWSPTTAVSYLRQGEAGWAEISARFSNRAPLEAELRSLREAVYKHDMCYDTLTYDYFESYTAYKNALNQIKRVGR
jgi:hypothetical protein